ncbi:hypothetical protein E3N88_26431 [Mikania micrantha]|uniref:Aminotransferase-like plant mobile domain-containing protein n=1 Tax=Mikania micrantha TaxID=192012 RepID=A0A5N6N8K4_9ASTR|nr:hypothetical protein E3N88_26431 [Mikania micrantha]
MVKNILNNTGFGGIIDCGYRMVDHALITALVERWRPETHTFHLTVGEATVTLQDVNILWGLPIEGEPVSGVDFSFKLNELIERCELLLGFTPSNTDIVGGRIKLVCLLNQLENDFPENPNALQCTQRARLIILYLCGGTLFPDSTNSKFAWTPYDSIMERLPFICRNGEASWTSECFLILWEVVEPHHSSRVMRQFGLLQNIPNPIPLTMNQHHTIYNLNRGGKLNKDWLRHHQQYVSSWNQRLTNAIDGQHVPTPTVSDDYMRWYRSRTVLYITNPRSEEVRRFQNDGGAYQLMHIQGWVGRMMNWRQRQQQKGATDMRWSILPPQFYDYLVDSCTKNTVSFANGKSSPFPSFFDVDYVYFPFCVENNEWLLVQVELQNVNLVMCCSECFSNEKYRRAVHLKLMQISVYFCALLVNIKYFKKTGFPPKVMSFEVNEDYVQSHADLYGNQGVHACMLMEHLVTGKPLNISNNFRESCIAYRRFMADQIYFCRCFPRPG